MSSATLRAAMLALCLLVASASAERTMDTHVTTVTGRTLQQATLPPAGADAPPRPNAAARDPVLLPAAEQPAATQAGASPSASPAGDQVAAPALDAAAQSPLPVVEESPLPSPDASPTPDADAAPPPAPESSPTTEEIVNPATPPTPEEAAERDALPMRPLPPSLRPEANETSPAEASCPEYEQTCRDQCGTTEEAAVTCGDPANGVEPSCKCSVRSVAPTGVDTPQATNDGAASAPPTNRASRNVSGAWSIVAATVAAAALALL